ncbi:MAG: glycoside hydrolase family 1 protein [Clostridiales bacterium]|nr:glycoside hydrolase family 1 protein [Clostridiales bacterium]
MYDVFSLKDFSFPEGFLWGSGYAGHQVEGNNIHSQWWAMEQKGYFEHKSGLACNSYDMYREDVDLVAGLGHQAFRTSVEWSRIEPQEGEFDPAALDHYVKLFAALKERGVKVFATMVHIAWPEWFQQKGQFSKIENLPYFERYLEYVVPKIAPYVDFWNVLNEFNLGTSETRITEKFNTIKFHARGYHIIKQYSSAPVSTAHALVQYMPYRPWDRWDLAMTELQDLRNHEFFFHAMRTGEILFPERDGVYDAEVKDTVDYWSVNCYVRSMIDARRQYLNGDRYQHKELKMTNMESFYLEEMHPEGLLSILGRLRDKPIYITENGCSCDDDRFRIVYLSLYLSALADAIRLGADVRGYLQWSLLDNYEWGSFAPHFGLCSVDPKTFARTPKPSAYFYRDLIANNGFTGEILRRYLTELPSLGLGQGR